MSILSRSAPAPSTLATNVGISLLGLMLGFTVAPLAAADKKWMVAGLALLAVPCFLKVMGSLRDSLMAMLVASLSVGLDVNPGYNDYYMTLRKGIAISVHLVILIAAMGSLWWGVVTRGKRLRYYPSVTLPLLVVLLFAALSSLNALYPAYVAHAYPMVVTCALIFFYAANAVVRPTDVRFVANWIALTVAVSSILALAEFFTGGAVNLTFLGAREEVLVKQYEGVALARVSGALGHSNTLSLYLNGFLPLLVAYAVAVPERRLRLGYLAAFGLGFVTQILTFARAGWAAAGGSIAMLVPYFFTRRARLQFPSAWARLLGAGALAGVLMLPLLPSIIFRLTEDDYGAAYQRIPLMEGALKVIAANPVLGVGLENYKQAVSRYDFDPPMTGPSSREGPTPNHVHNMYLLTAAEIGIPSLIMLLWMCGVFIYRGLRCAFGADAEASLFAMGALAGLAGILAHGMVEPGNFSMIKYVWIMFLGGLLVAVDSLRRSEASGRA